MTFGNSGLCIKGFNIDFSHFGIKLPLLKL